MVESNSQACVRRFPDGADNDDPEESDVSCGELLLDWRCFAADPHFKDGEGQIDILGRTVYPLEQRIARRVKLAE